jgi:hypothetical protein
MIKYLLKRGLSDKKNSKEFLEKKKKAMEMFDEILRKENKETLNRLHNGENEEDLIDFDYYKKNKEKYASLMNEMNFIQTEKKTNKEYKTFINDNVFNCSVDLNNTDLIDRNWIVLYSQLEDKSFEKFNSFLFTLFLSFISINTFWYIKDYLIDKKQTTKLKIIKIILFYTFAFGLIFLHRSQKEKMIKKIILNHNDQKSIKIIKKNNEEILTNVSAFYSISSQKRNLLELYYGENKNNKLKPRQVFLNKNGIYKYEILFNLCNPKVEYINIINL